MSTIDIILRVILLGAFGLGLEVIFTSIGSYRDSKKRNRAQLFGHSSIWYLPLYGVLMPTMYYLYEAPLEDYNWLVRGLAYAVTIQAGEALTMWILRVLNGESPSERSYRQSGKSWNGLTRPRYFYAFFVLGLLFEYFYELVF